MVEYQKKYLKYLNTRIYSNTCIAMPCKYACIACIAAVFDSNFPHNTCIALLCDSKYFQNLNHTIITNNANNASNYSHFLLKIIQNMQVITHITCIICIIQIFKNSRVFEPA